MADRHLVVHGHFYQPPRENPWTESVPVEPSAAPFHDWNERITAECYRPNAHTRIVDERGFVHAIVNDYALLSFNVGPTLASWLEQHAPDTYALMQDADRAAGTAIAQAYNHMILPLASERDVRTQIRWGLADFTHRFGRRAAGMWLPETAVNDAVLAVLVEEGVEFTILAPRQLDRTPEPGRAYWWGHPGGRGRIALVVYDGGLSHDVAFGAATRSAAQLVERAEAAAPDGLVVVATDGETFGHHQHFAERAVAYALAVEAPRRGIGTGPLGPWLEANPPQDTIGVVESAWSCAHGVGRWREDCGCATGGDPGWNQRWRTPLRAALDVVRDHAGAVFARVGAGVFRDPWAARDDYIRVVLDPAAVTDFARRHVRRRADLTLAFTLLEAQRHAMLMYTSCGWFFADIAGLEAVQVLRYAARCLDLLREAGDDPPEDAVLALLANAHSNDPAVGTGRDVWQRHVTPVRIGPSRVVAHIALLELLDGLAPEAVVAGHDVTVSDHGHLERGRLGLASGRVTLKHRRTHRVTTFVYAALHLGGLDVVGACRPAGDATRDAASLAALRSSFSAGDRLTELLRAVIDGFGPEEFDVSAALPDAPDRLFHTAARSLSDRFGAEMSRLYADHRDVFTALTSAGHPLPDELRVTAQLALARRLEADFVALTGRYDRGTVGSALSIVAEAMEAGVDIDIGAVRAAATRAVEALTKRATASGSAADANAATSVLELARHGHVVVDVSRAQEAVYQCFASGTARSAALNRLANALGIAPDAT